MGELCDNAVFLAREIERLSTECGIKELEKDLKVIEKSIKDAMITGNLDVVGRYKLKRTTKQKFNEALFAEQNEKLYNKYLEETISYTLSKDMKEEEKDDNEN